MFVLQTQRKKNKRKDKNRRRKDTQKIITVTSCCNFKMSYTVVSVSFPEYASSLATASYSFHFIP